MKFAPFEAEDGMRFRLWIFMFMLGLGLVGAVWLFRLLQLQAVDAAYYKEVSRGNRIRVAPLEGPRGVIYDRQGQIVAYNRAAFTVQLTPEDTADLEETLANLSYITRIPAARFRERLRRSRSTGQPAFAPVVLLQDVGRRVADVIDTYQEDLAGVSLKVEFKRLYPAAVQAAHVVGYVGAINPEQLRRLRPGQIHSGRVVGRAGVERMWNQQLLGADGGRQVEVDHLGRVLKVLGQPVVPRPGQDLYLSLDLRLQRYALEQLRGHNGVILATRPATGEVLALASLPHYDPNVFVEGLDADAWRALVSGKGERLINKAVQGQYPPGSTFKMVLALAALEEGLITPETKLHCPGHFRVGRRGLRYCWKRKGHGELALVQALAQSCNVFFYQLGQQLGVDTIGHYARLLGFGQPTGIRLESEKSGLVPSKAWKQKTYQEPWFDGETAPVSIGQGYLTVTPLQLLYYVNAIANGGVWVPPRLALPYGGKNTQPSLPALLSVPGARRLPFRFAHIEVVRQGLLEAVNGAGTARRARSRHFQVAGKTGTSEVVGRKTGEAARQRTQLSEAQLPHSIFVGYAPAGAPQLSVLVLIEHSKGSGGEIAAPLARNIITYYARHLQPFTRPGPLYAPPQAQAGPPPSAPQRPPTPLQAGPGAP